ncbi:Uncharacterized protein APZ42_028469 [Daphnia magna]|uniref:Uncharacterized protein n=1 Tax=Daphnia magna TaxID=35525 RepID=A0A164QHF3_9CRUS|nr:Uncharacterized protein APZ42_028469 [Daphnia magna]
MTATTDKSVIPSIAATVPTSVKPETTTTRIRPLTTATKPTTTFKTTTTKSTTTTKKPTTTTKKPTTTTQKPTTTTQKPTTTTQKPSTTTVKSTTITQISASTPKSTTTSKPTTKSTEAEQLPTITSTTASTTLTSTSLKTAIMTQSSTTTEKVNTETTAIDKIKQKTNQAEIISSTKPTISLKYPTPIQTREQPSETTTSGITKSKDYEEKDIDKIERQKNTTRDESEIQDKSLNDQFEVSRQQKENIAHERVVDDYRPLNDANTSNGLPKSTEELSDLIKYELEKMHEQYKISIETEHDNKLAKIIRMSAALGLPMCTRIYGFCQAMTLQQCDPKRISLSAKETKCGFQPFFVYGKNNCTIGLDGWSIHPYSECLWKSQRIIINGYPHTWQHNATAGDWIKQEATIHTSNLDLIAKFEELHLNSFDYGLRNHLAHETMEMEQLKILNDLVGRINEGEGKDLSNILVTEEQDNQIGNMFSWFDTLKIMALSAIGFILFLICLRIFIACNPIPRIKQSFRRRKQSRKVSESDIQEMDFMIPEPIYSAGGANEKPFVREFAPLMTSAKEKPKENHTSINTPSAPKKGKLYPFEELKWENEQNKECTGSHTTCSYVVGYGMVW